MAPGEKRRRSKATAEVITLVENAVAWIKANRDTARAAAVNLSQKQQQKRFFIRSLIHRPIDPDAYSHSPVSQPQPALTVATYDLASARTPSPPPPFTPRRPRRPGR
jgi:hypothetical protein